jgi:hypothetical protein
MTGVAATFRPGDLVEVKTPDEILATLDADGTLDRLPFMPEMVPRRCPLLRRRPRRLSAGMRGVLARGVAARRRRFVAPFGGVCRRQRPIASTAQDLEWAGRVLLSG